jgi:hypothetical protein
VAPGYIGSGGSKLDGSTGGQSRWSLHRPEVTRGRPPKQHARGQAQHGTNGRRTIARAQGVETYGVDDLMIGITPSTAAPTNCN